MEGEIAFPNGDVFCLKGHGYQRSGDNTCEPCYVDRARIMAPVLNKMFEKVIENMDLTYRG